MLSAKSAQFELHLLNWFEALGTSPDNDTTTMMEAALETVGRDKPAKPDKLTAETHQLREKLRETTRGGTQVHHIEHTEICKAIRQQTKDDINKYHKEQQLKALEENRGLKSVKKRSSASARRTSLPSKRMTTH